MLSKCSNIIGVNNRLAVLNKIGNGIEDRKASNFLFFDGKAGQHLDVHPFMIPIDLAKI